MIKDWLVKVYRNFAGNTCEVCGKPTRTVKALAQVTTHVRFCSKRCRRARHNSKNLAA